MARFLCRVILIFALLAIPWPGWRDAQCKYLLAVARAILPAASGNRELSFQTLPGQNGGHLLGRVVIVNDALMAADGSGPVRNLDMDLGTLCAESFALLLALTWASPTPRRRRGVAALLGVAALHCCIIGLIAYCIWAESSEVQLVHLTPAMRRITGALEISLLAQFSIALPVLLWAVVTFRNGDTIRRFRRMITDHPPRPSAQSPARNPC